MELQFVCNVDNNVALSLYKTVSPVNHNQLYNAIDEKQRVSFTKTAESFKQVHSATILRTNNPRGSTFKCYFKRFF